MLKKLPRRVKIEQKQFVALKPRKKIDALSEDMFEDNECFQHSSFL